MRFDEVVTASAEVGATRSRKQKQARLAVLLRALREDEIEVAVAFLSGALPQGQIGLGWASFRDLEPGPPAREASLELLEVHRRFDELAGIAGPGSKARRRDALSALFARATQAERDFVVKLVTGELRQGALGGVMAEAVAEATGIDAAKLRRAAMLAGAPAEVASAALLHGEAALERFALTLFRPVLPMLASPADDIDAALERLGTAVFELKLDGARVQVHKGGDEVRVYSRRLREVSAAVPEIVAAARALRSPEVILDGEVIALRGDGSPHPFQTTMRRFGRKTDPASAVETLPLSAFYFDVLRMNGEDWIDRPARERLAVLDQTVASEQRPARITSDDGEEAEAFFQRALTEGHEGLMAKGLDDGYAAGSRGFAWLKLKPAHTLDLVVIAVERGSGRRRGWLSNLHLAAREPRDGSFVMLGKTFKGMTDEMLRWQTTHLQDLSLGEQGHVVHVKPELVVEIAFSDVQQSPVYPGGMALRFARVKRYRTDKNAEDAATIDEVRAIFTSGHRRRV